MLCLNFACTCVTRVIRNYGVNEFFADKVIVILISARGNKRNTHARACDAEDTRGEGNLTHVACTANHAHALEFFSFFCRSPRVELLTICESQTRWQEAGLVA